MIYFELCQRFFHNLIDIFRSIVRDNLKGTAMSRKDFFNNQLSYELSAVLSGTAKASGQPLNQSTKAMMYLFPDTVVGYGPERSLLSFAMGYGGMSVSCNG